MGKFNIFYQQEEEYFVLLTQIEDTLSNVLDIISNYPKDKIYQLEKVNLTGSEIININNI